MRLIGFVREASRIGCSARFDDDTNRRIVVINCLSVVGILLHFCFGVYSLVNDYLWMGVLLIVISIALIVARLILDTQRPSTEQFLPSSILIVSLFSLMVLLIVTGGNDNTGPMWIFVLPPVAMFFAGLQLGLRIIAVFVAIISVLLFYPDNQLLLTTYTTGFKVRFLISLLTTVAFSSLYEHSRNRSVERIQKLNEQYEHLAMHDVLTGLPNRRYMQKQLSQELARVKRSNSCTGVILCDIDNFKRFNDTYGHDCGDEVLKHFANTLCAGVREQDWVGRWGGEEFLFILPNTDVENTFQVAESVRESLYKDCSIYKGQALQISASFGVNVMTSTSHLDSLLTSVDEALYHAKKQGKNCAVKATSTDTVAGAADAHSR